MAGYVSSAVGPLLGGESALPPLQGRACDRLDCPAPALHRVDAFHQDFYFCHHHWREVDPALGSGPDPHHLEELVRADAHSVHPPSGAAIVPIA